MDPHGIRLMNTEVAHYNSRHWWFSRSDGPGSNRARVRIGWLASDSGRRDGLSRGGAELAEKARIMLPISACSAPLREIIRRLRACCALTDQGQARILSCRWAESGRGGL